MSWTRDAVRTEVLRGFLSHAPEGAVVPKASHLVADLGIHPLGVMGVLADVEDTFKITVLEDALRHVSTLAEVASAIEGRLAEDGRLS